MKYLFAICLGCSVLLGIPTASIAGPGNNHNKITANTQNALEEEAIAKEIKKAPKSQAAKSVAAKQDGEEERWEEQ